MVTYSLIIKIMRNTKLLIMIKNEMIPVESNANTTSISLLLALATNELMRF